MRTADATREHLTNPFYQPLPQLTLLKNKTKIGANIVCELSHLWN